jgi:hypothetical protein
MGDFLKSLQELLLRIWSFDNNKHHIQRLVPQFGMQPKSFSQEPLKTISIMGFTDFTGNTEGNTGMRQLSQGRLIETNQRMSKTSLALLT